MSIIFHNSEPGIAVLQIDRPERRNALNWDAMEAFSAAIEKAHLISDLKALVLTGTGNAFCSGGDLKELADYNTYADGRRLSEVMSAALKRLMALPFPTIAAMNGPARGGGAEIALACDLRVMAMDADLGLMHINIGITPAWGGGQRLLRLVGYSRALEWLATGRILSATEAMTHGLANRLAPMGEAMQEAMEMARMIASRPSTAVRAIKRILCAGISLSSAAAARIERSEFPTLWADEVHHQLVDKFFQRKRA